MWTITRRRFKKNRRGISNIIVIVLSLVIILAIVSNIVLWSYELNQHDWEKMKEEASITNVEQVTGSSWFGAQSEYTLNTGIHVNGTYADTQAVDDVFERFMEASVAPYNPSEYSLGGSTSWISGSVPDLASDDEAYMTFRSYSSGTDTADFVDDNTSNVDSSADKGTHSNFANQQAGPDSVYDILTEENAGGGSATFGKTDIGGTSYGSSGYLEASRYQCGQDGTVTQITLYLTGGSFGRYARAAIYSDNSGAPGSLLGESSSQEIASSGWQVFTGFNVPVSASTYYWLAFQMSTSYLQWRYDNGAYNQHAYRSYSYGSFPSSFGTPGYSAFEQSIYATSSSAANYELDLEAQWTNVDYYETNEELCIYFDSETTGSNTHSLDATGGYMRVGNGTPDWGSTTGTISFWVQWDTVDGRPWGQHDNMETRFSGTNLVLDWGGTSSLTSSTSFTSGKWYFIAIVWDEFSNDLILYVGDEDSAPTVDASTGSWFSAVSTIGVTQNNFMNSRAGFYQVDGRGDDLRYWNTDRSLAAIQSDYDTELTGSETNLRSYFKLNNNFDDIGPDNNDGSGSGSYSFSSSVPFGGSPAENLRVDVWTGSSWQNIFTDLTNGWNNASVSSYLDSSTFTIRFKGGTETSDTTQDSWNIDATLLHVWSIEYTLEVEFTGSSDAEDWSQLTWTADSAWTTGSVNVTMQLYNFTLGAYPTSGDGYINYLSSATADTDETKSQTITENPTQFRNATSQWKMKIKGVKTTATSFDFKADQIELSPENYQLDMNGAFTIDTSTYSLEDIQAVEIQLRYRADDSAEDWYLKAYNWTASTYSYNGFNSTSGHTPTTGWDYYAVNFTDVWQSYVYSNGTINIKLVDSGVDSNQTSVDIDFLGVRVIMDGTQFTFKNDGSLTLHLVSLWITNSTNHQRYDINVFVNSADTKNYLRTDISLPAGSFSVKVVTERGNMAVYSGS